MDLMLLKAILYCGVFGLFTSYCIPNLMSIPVSAVGGYVIGMAIARGIL